MSESEDVTKGKDDLGDFEERAAKKEGETDQFVDPFKRKDKAKAKDLDEEIDEEQKAKEAPYRVKLDKNGEPVDQKEQPAVEDVKKKSKKGKGPKEVKGKELKGRSNIKVRINEDTGDEEDEPEAGLIEK